MSLRGNHRHFQVAAQRTARHAEILDDPDLGQKVFHKVARAKVDSLERGNTVQFLLQVVQAHHRPRLVRLVGANAAENHGILHAGVLNRRHQGIAHPLLVLPHVGDRGVGRNHQINCLCSAKGLGKRRRIADVGNKGFGALLNKAFQTTGRRGQSLEPSPHGPAAFRQLHFLYSHSHR